MRIADEEIAVSEGCRHKLAEEVLIYEEDRGIRKTIKYKCPKNK